MLAFGDFSSGPAITIVADPPGAQDLLRPPGERARAALLDPRRLRPHRPRRPGCAAVRRPNTRKPPRRTRIS